MVFSKKKTESKKQQPFITAVDLGTSKITAIIATINGEGKLEIQGIGETSSDGLQNGMIKDIRLTSESLKIALGEAEEMASVKADKIYVSVSGEYIKSTNANSRLTIGDDTTSESNVVKQQHVDKVGTTAVEIVLTQEGDKSQKVIHALPQSYQVDNQKNTLSPLEMSGDMLTAHLHIVLANINCIRNIRRCFELIGYDAGQIVFSPLATCKSILTPDEMRHGCILIDIGAGTTDILFFLDSIIMLSAVIPIGGNDISADISRILQTSSSAAEQIKIKFGSALSPESDSPEATQELEVPGIGGRKSTYKSLSLLCNIIQSRIQDLLESTYTCITDDELDKYVNAGIVITGGSSELKNIDELTGEIFNMPVRIGIPDTSGISFSSSGASFGSPDIQKQSSYNDDDNEQSWLTQPERNKDSFITSNSLPETLASPKYATIVGLLYYAKDCLYPSTRQRSFNDSPHQSQIVKVKKSTEKRSTKTQSNPGDDRFEHLFREANDKFHKAFHQIKEYISDFFT